MTTEQPTPILDDIARVQAVDKRNMLRLINELPEQCETALGLGRSFIVEPLDETPGAVFISGVGDSGVAADMALQAISDDINVPVVSDHGGRLPKYIGENAVVFVLDYSGKSESSLRVYRDARQRGARVICITSGGKLNEAASKDGVKVVKIPPGQPARTAIGYMFVPLISALERLGLVSGLEEKLSYGIRLMKNVREALRFENPTLRNSAKQIALALADRIIVIHGAPDYRSAVAARWKSQINANSKSPAFVSLFPSVADGDISGWERSESKSDDLAFVFLTDAGDKTEIVELMNASREVLASFSVVNADIKGSTVIEKILYGVYMADYVSYYLALIHDVNPTANDYVSAIEAQRTENSAPEEPLA